VHAVDERIRALIKLKFQSLLGLTRNEDISTPFAISCHSYIPFHIVGE